VERRHSQDEALDIFQDLAATEIAHRVRSSGSRGGTAIHVRSLVADPNKRDWIAYLSVQYQGLLEKFDPGWGAYNVLKDDPASEVYLHSSLVDLSRLFRGEEGVHLFYPAHRGGIPVQVRVLSIPEGVDSDEFTAADAAERARALTGFESGDGAEVVAPPERAVRVYCPPGPGSEGTATDLSTGQIAPYWVPAPTWFLWVYGSLPASERIVFDG
jgi:hypothetical protein